MCRRTREAAPKQEREKMDADGTVLVLAELDADKEILPLSLECVTAAKRLAATWGGRAAALIMGHGVAAAAREMACYGVDDVLLVDHPALDGYQAELYLSTFLQVWERQKPKAILMGDTLTSVDLAPRIACSLDAGLVADCVAIEADTSDVNFIKPVYSSNVMAAYAFASEPWIVTLRARAEEAAPKAETRRAEIIPLEVKLDLSAMKTEVVQRVVEGDEGIRLAEAHIVVSGGRGLGGPEGFEQLVELAKVLHAAVGASRPPCDLGWVPSQWQVGQTGAKVAPAVYIAAGISGATQHIAGMQGSKKIVAINRDRTASIFRIADYGVVGSCEEVLPAFREALTEMLR
jgi:electron transfer flavoprotein alpha subunit